jgi:hypothetical protein
MPRASRATASTRIDDVLTAFERELDDPAVTRHTRFTCVVGSDLVRFRVVPWSDELTRPAQRQALAQHCFKEAFGDVADAWSVNQHPGQYGEPSLACALDTVLLDRIEVSMRVRGLKLVSVQPWLAAAYNRAPPAVGHGPSWLVCVELAWTTLLLMSGRAPVHVRQLASAGLDLDVALNREWVSLGLEGPRPPAIVATLQVDNGALSWTHSDTSEHLARWLAA